MASIVPVAGAQPMYWVLPVKGSPALCLECLSRDRTARLYFSARRARKCGQCGYSHRLVSQERALAPI